MRAPSFKLKARLESEAEAALRRAMALDPQDGRPYVSLGKLLVSQRRLDEARSLYDTGATATGGRNAHVWQSWATLEARAGDARAAARLYDAATVADPAHAAAWHGWGLLEKRRGDPSRARDLWVKGVRSAPRGAPPNPHLHQSLAVLAADTGYMEEARSWFRKATSHRVGAANAAVWHAWALAEARGGDRASVRYLFGRGLTANPRSRYVHLSWALWEEAQGQRANARALFKRGVELNPRDAALLQAWALLEEKAGDLPAARSLLDRASRVDPRHVPVWLAWALLEAGAGDAEKARGLFRTGVLAAPASKDVARVWQAWACLEAKAGDARAARQLFKAAVKADPGSEPAWLAWAAFEEGEGAYARADELRNFHAQDRTSLALPASFRASLDPVVATAPRAADAVVAAVSDWWARLETARAPGRRRRPGDAAAAAAIAAARGDEGGDDASDTDSDVPPMEKMREFDTPRLARKAAPAVSKPRRPRPPRDV